MNFIIKIINALISLVGLIFGGLVEVLPKSPFTSFNEFLDSSNLAYFNWLFPIKEIVDVLLIWAGCIALYYGYSFVMRRLNLIR